MESTTCQYDVTGEQPAAPTVLCYQTATWNPTTCQYDVTGEQPAAPTVLCYQTATWNPTTCQYDVVNNLLRQLYCVTNCLGIQLLVNMMCTGEQLAAPTVVLPNSWNPTTCHTM
ncbi:MAG: hypothetical protein R2805_06610 [Flavobacterium sp.]|uniref:hypothetical protein n=1 Tax=Flavobacterium sp. TaxID=239 RepID=UPI003527B234